MMRHFYKITPIREKDWGSDREYWVFSYDREKLPEKVSTKSDQDGISISMETSIKKSRTHKIGFGPNNRFVNYTQTMFDIIESILEEIRSTDGSLGEWFSINITRLGNDITAKCSDLEDATVSALELLRIIRPLSREPFFMDVNNYNGTYIHEEIDERGCK